MSAVRTSTNLRMILCGPSSVLFRSGCCVALFSKSNPKRKNPMKSKEKHKFVLRRVSISVHSFATRIVLQHDTDPLLPLSFGAGSQSTKNTSERFIHGDTIHDIRDISCVTDEHSPAHACVYIRYTTCSN